MSVSFRQPYTKDRPRAQYGAEKFSKEYLEKRSWERNVDDRIQVQLEEDGGGSTRQSWMETSSAVKVIEIDIEIATFLGDRMGSTKQLRR